MTLQLAPVAQFAVPVKVTSGDLCTSAVHMYSNFSVAVELCVIYIMYVFFSCFLDSFTGSYIELPVSETACFRRLWIRDRPL
jgi:hypothetical protein